jgi:receptor protein-tyrosine kinase
MSTIEKALEKLMAKESSVVGVEKSAEPSAEPMVVTNESSESANTVVLPAAQGVDPQEATEPLVQVEISKADHLDDSLVHRESAVADADVKATNQKHEIHIDFSRLSELNFVSLATERRLISEEYRVIKRKLINNAFGPLSTTLNHPNLILVSSTRPGEGKTFTSVNLALSIALEQDKTVLLVDTDVLRPNVARTLDIQVPLGLTDYLSGDDVKVNDILYSTNVERLKIIAAGRPHHLSTELLASDKMVALANEFASRYPDRIVIFDAPPLLGITETAVLASMCGQAVVVLEENKTKLNELEKALSLLPKELAVGFVINKAYYSRDKGYGYGYGYYAQ